MKQFLKKTFPLFLLIALLPGFLLTPAWAARPTDLDQAIHREAVELMVDLGVIQGKTDGTFAPKSTVDRATMAKLLYGILAGETDPVSFSSVDTGLIDIAGNWAENYIKYCYSVGIISGKGDSTFDPDGVVNVASAAKMLLVTLGYDALDRGYSSDPLWSDNIMADAQGLGLLNGITQFSFEPLTRDNAAQMLYNALFTYTRTPKYALRDGEKVIISYTQNPSTLGLETLRLVRYTVKIGAVTKDAPPEISFVSLFPKANNVKDEAKIMRLLQSGEASIPIGPELAGSYAVIYVKANWSLSTKEAGIENLTLEKIYSSALTPKPVPVLGSSTAGVPITGEGAQPSLTSPGRANTAYRAVLDSSSIYLINGEAVTLAEANRAASIRGTVVDLLDANGNGKADIVKITVKYTGVMTGDVETRWVDGQEQVRFPGLSGLSDWTISNTVLGRRDLKRGDGVLAVKIGNTIYVEKANAISGYAVVASGEDGVVLKVDGKGYRTSGLLAGKIPGWSGVSGNYVFYLDNNGDIFGAMPAN